MPTDLILVLAALMAALSFAYFFFNQKQRSN
jgi:hypothetical protein